MLELRELDVFYGDAQALKSLSFKVEEGSLVALVGSNGAGKTTVLKTIAGLIMPDGGHIEFLGEDLTLLRPEEIVERGISMVPEGRWLFTKMTLADNLILGAYTPRARKSASDSMTHVLQLFPFLTPRLRRLAGSLSGGEQQMLAIGRALMSRPRLLMLDEPSLGLAPLIVQTMFGVIEKLYKEGVTVLLVEQNVYETLRLAQMAFVIKTGTISLYGEGKVLLEDPGVQKAFLGIDERLT
jgi:branched-chain amino acid transport system ATP-binding protein